MFPKDFVRNISNDFTLDYGRIHGLFIKMIKLRPVEENKA